jgi:FtsH-binding integral membrane protein
MIAFGFFYKTENENVSEILIIVGLFAFIGVFGLTLGPLTWMYIP